MSHPVRERVIEKYLCSEVQKAGGLCWKFSSPGNAGVPDRIVMCGGRVCFVEVKRPGEKPRALQVEMMRRMVSRGAWVEVVDSYESVDALMRSITS